jgi:hypothetical protein
MSGTLKILESAVAQAAVVLHDSFDPCVSPDDLIIK